MNEGWYRAALGLGRVAFRALDVTVETRGLENIPTSGPVILAATHVSYLDSLPICLAARRRGRFPRFMSRKDVWGTPGLAGPMNRMGHIPVDRDAPAAAYLTARALLRDGEAVGIFPEAGITYSYTVRSLMRGTAALARETGAVVVPTALWGVQRLYSVGRPVDGVEPRPDLTRGRTIDLRFGDPTSVGPGEDLGEWTAKLGLTLTQMLEDLQVLRHHRPRPGEHAPWYPAHLGGHAPDRREALALDDVPRSAISPSWGPTDPSPRCPAVPCDVGSAAPVPG